MRIFLALILFLFPTEDRLVNWENSFHRTDDIVEIEFYGEIADGWYIYSSKLDVDGPLPAKIVWEKNDSYEVIGDLEPIEPKSKFDPVWEGKISYFEHKAGFKQKVRIKNSKPIIKGSLRYQACINDPEDGRCVNEEFKFQV